MNYGEMFLLGWAMVATALLVVSRHNAQDFKRHTLFKLKMVAEGKAKIVLGDDFVAIRVNGEEV